MRRFLVTGGCGFIGSHLVEALLARGDGVRVLDDLSTGHLENLPPGAEFVRGCITDAGLVARALRDADGCFHLAAIASVERAKQDWAATHRVNLSGTVTVFEAAAARRTPVVYASSAAVYGDPAALPITEDTPTRPLSAYGADKLGCELHARVAGGVHGIPTAGFRFFNVFGPRQDPRSPYSGVISIFLDRLLRGEELTVFGDGLQTRDFVYVSDVVAALLAGMEGASPRADVFNVCTGIETSVRDLAATIAQACGAPLTLRHLPARAGEIRHSLGAPERLRRQLGLGRCVPLAEGLSETIAWQRGAKPAAAA